MSDSENGSCDDMPPSSRTPQRFQFSLAWLLMAVTVVAVLLGLSQTTIGFYAVVSLFSGLINGILPAVLLVCALFGRGELRVFSIGALVPWVVSRPPVSVSVGSLQQQFALPLWWPIVVMWAFTLITAAVSGVVAIGVHRWLRRRGYGL
jgi:hypothetical protein